VREFTHGDAVAAASALRVRPPETWEGWLVGYLDRAHAADRFRKRTGRVHPRWGNGSLMSAILCDMPVWPEPRLSDPAYAEALVAVLEALIRWRRRAL
jgi:hypothetical protein